MQNFYLIILSFYFIACNGSSENKRLDEMRAQKNRLDIERIIDNAQQSDNLQEKKHSITFSLQDFYSTSSALQSLVNRIYDSLTISQRAAQLIMPATSEYDKIGIPFSEIRTAVDKNQIGGVLYLKGRKSKFASQIAELNSLTKAQNKPGLISACDCEPSLYHKKFTDEDSVIATSEMTTDALVDKGTITISQKIKQMGIVLNFAPVADIAINQEVIGNRAFSAIPAEVVSLASRFVQTSQRNGVAATIKHFPGHGAVIGDTHKGDVYINGDLTEIQNFSQIIDIAHPVAVMVGHMRIQNSEFENMPSTISRKVITGLLREQLQFNGIIVTDAMQMKAVLAFPNASWKALVAGADLIIMPLNISTLHRQIIASLKEDKKMAKQLTQSIKRVIRLKVCTGIIQ